MKTFVRFVLLLFAASLSVASGNAQTLTPQAWGKKLRQDFPQERERAYAIYYWLTHNITYDWEAFHASRPTDQSPAAVLQRKKALCEGFAALYHLLAQESGLICRQVRGVTKGIGYQVGNPVDRSNHVWNAVQINGKWELIDATWGSGNGNDAPPNDTYFMIRPELLIFTHFPEEERWQLLERPVSLHEFERKPIIYPLFGEHQPQLLQNARELIIQTDRDSLQIHLRMPLGAIVMANLTDAQGNRRETKPLTADRSGNVALRINGLQRGQYYRCDIFATPADTVRRLYQLITYFINYGGKVKYFTRPDSRLQTDSLTAMPMGFIQDYLALQQQKNYAVALELLNEYVPYYGSNAWLQTAIGENLEQLGRTDEAETAYLKALNLQADYYRANYALGVLYYNRAVRANEALRNMPADQQRAKSADVGQEVRQWFARAKPYFEAARRKRPDNTNIVQALQQIEQVLK